MPRYLLPCPCGKPVTVEPRQAGKEVVCECGQSLQAPSLRQIRELPPAPTDAGTRGAGWGARQGVLTAGLLVAAALAGVGAYFQSMVPPAPTEFDRDEQVAQGLDVLTPLGGLQLWRQQYLPIFASGRIEPYVDQREVFYEQRLLMSRIYRAASFGLAAVVGVVTIAVASSIRGRK